VRRDLTRRSAITGLTGAALAAPAIIGRSRPAVAAAADFDRELAPALRSHAPSSGIKFGCAGAAPNVQPDGILLQKFAIEANIFVPESALKWNQTEPAPGAFNFAEGDSIAAFAARNDMLVHGHTLVWYAAIPEWVSHIATARDATAALERHISTEVSRYRGKIWAWDVVNEAIEPNDWREDGYRTSVWFNCLGADYIDLSFRLARSADQNVPLCLSEYGVEYATSESQRRREALLALLRDLRDRNTPIDCLALQSHLDAERIFDRPQLTAFLRDVVELGYKLAITELDVNDYKLRGGPEERDVAVARHVTEYLDIVMSVAKPISIATWGLSDRYTWLRQYFKRSDGSPLRPLPLDANFNRKRMWAALASSITA
jgi:endo-1,4-beta-xylanase